MKMNFVPECYFDTVLVKNILQVDKVNHRHGSPNVIKELSENKKLADDFAVAIVDKDKKELKSVKNVFFEVKELSTNNLILLKHETKNHYLIQLIPAVEQWVLNIITESDIDVSDLKVPLELDELKEYTKYRFVNENEELKRLCKRLIKSDNQTMQTLTFWLTYLYKENRNADVEIMKNWG